MECINVHSCRNYFFLIFGGVFRCQAVQNLGLAVVAILSGNIVDKWGYTVLESCFLASLAVALATTVFLYILDRSQNGMLNLTAKTRLSLV